jgi:hypothetical protein
VSWHIGHFLLQGLLQKMLNPFVHQLRQNIYFSLDSFKVITDRIGNKINLSAKRLSTIYGGHLSPIYGGAGASKVDLSNREQLHKVEKAVTLVDQLYEFKCGNDIGIGVIEFNFTGGHHRYEANWPLGS